MWFPFLKLFENQSNSTGQLKFRYSGNVDRLLLSFRCYLMWIRKLIFTFSHISHSDPRHSFYGFSFFEQFSHEILSKTWNTQLWWISKFIFYWSHKHNKYEWVCKTLLKSHKICYHHHRSLLKAFHLIQLVLPSDFSSDTKNIVKCDDIDSGVWERKEKVEMMKWWIAYFSENLILYELERELSLFTMRRIWSINPGWFCWGIFY